MLAGDDGIDVANADTMVRHAPRRTTEPHAMPGACVQNVSAPFQVTAPPAA
ncbi:hypothetical protein [Burkholderia sp. RF2-non_BP3]|uniref:hypothetical protein n=1 Tax=Burkholderia sp. RF2-non_BP3 TaxID=1637844 RepID=UPI000AA6F397|nr:hypothetical protein [Burkholderia sp. RF2-non_BP3]